MTQQECAAPIRRDHFVGRYGSKDRPDPVRELVDRRRRAHGGEPAVRQPKIDAAGGAYPECSIQSQKQALNCVFGEPVARAVLLKKAPVIAVQSVFRSHPEIAGLVLRKAVHIQVAQAIADVAETELLRDTPGHH